MMEIAFDEAGRGNDPVRLAAESWPWQANKVSAIKAAAVGTVPPG
jgi:hypothetical protein